MFAADTAQQVSTVLAATAPGGLTHKSNIKQVQGSSLNEQFVLQTSGNGHVGKSRQQEVDL